MRASKLITLSAVAALMGGANFAAAATAPQSGTAPQGGSTMHGANSPHHHGIGALSQGGVYGRANPREIEESDTGLSAQERMRTHKIMREIPRLSNIGGTDLRIGGLVPHGVRQAAGPLPIEVQHMHPRFRHDRAFLYHDQVVILNPATSRIVALIKTPT